MQITDLIFREMKEYDDQMIRPFYGDASPSLLNALEDATEGGRDLSPSRLAGIAGRMIRPIGETNARAAITGGWGEQRMMFAMRVLVRETRTSQIIHEISGYTGYMGADKSLRGVVIDENMPLYFNSVTRIGRNMTNTPRGNSWSTSIGKANQVIARQTNPDFTRVRGSQGTLTMRPADLFTRNSTNPVFADKVRQAGGSDMRGAFTNQSMKFSNLFNTGSTRFMARSLEALTAANGGDTLNDPYGQERDVQKVFKDARGLVREDAVTTDPVFEEMSRDSNILYDGFITYGELMQMNPDFDWDNVPVYFHEKGMRKSVRGEYAPWNGNDNVTVAVVMLVNALPMYLVNHQLASIDFTATNINTTGQMVVIADNAFPILEGPDLRDVVPILCRRLESEILQDMLPWPDCALDLTVSTSIAGETYVKISLDGAHEEEFVFPVFCNSVISPILTESEDNMVTMADTLAQVGDALGHSNRFDNDDRPSRIITEPGRLDLSRPSGKKRSF